MTQLGLETRFRRIEVPGSKVRDEMIFFNPEAGKYSAIGTVGIEIWQLLADRDRSLGEICDHLLAEFDVDRETCERDVSDFVKQMVDAGLLSRVHD